MITHKYVCGVHSSQSLFGAVENFRLDLEKKILGQKKTLSSLRNERLGKVARTNTLE